MYKLVLMRHGQSQWNLENRFTGWADVPLTELGVQQARQGGQLLKEASFKFDRAYCSVLQRAIHTLWHALDVLEQVHIPVTKDWQLNERHYGGLTGLNKSDMAKQFGEEQVKIWRRSFDVRPPALEKDDQRHPNFDKKYEHLTDSQRPDAECLKDTIERVVPYFETEIAPKIKAGEQILITAHGNSLRALVMYLDKLTPEQILQINIPTGQPLVYELDENLNPIKHYYLANEEAIAKEMAAVANQGKTA